MRKIVWGSDGPEEDTKADIKAEIYKEPSYVETVNNRIYFYSSIYQSEVLQLNRRIRELNNELLFQARVQDREPASIFLHINSNGGSIFSGLAAMDAVLNCEVPVVTVVDGCCASAATFLSVVGTRRLMSKHGFMLIHELTGATWGKYRELQDDSVNFSKFMDTIKLIYVEHTKIPVEKISEILEHDLWFDAKTCLEYGLVDEIC